MEQPSIKPKLLIVDDDEEIRAQMKWALYQDYEIFLAEDQSSALATYKDQQPGVVLLDLGLPPRPADPSEGLAALSELLSLDQFVKIIVITGQIEKDNALKAIGQGAYDFLCKPVQIEELRIILKRAFHVSGLEREFHEMRHGVVGESFEGMLGPSSRMQTVFASIRKVSNTDAPVLILGESGTGKEMAALAIHRRSARKDGPFVPINCGAIPDTLLESELFGHEKGSFTGAHVQRKGRIEMAAGGTLFLDEIGELPMPLQVKILRFLQEQTLERVGGRSAIQIDTRVVAATNSDLTKALHEGKFREDLYYRLAVVVLKLPPLRDREDDALRLAQSFLKRFASETAKDRVLSFNKQAIRAVIHYDWPGNVRELENRVRRAVIMADGRNLTAEDLELTRFGSLVSGRGLKEGRETVEREMIQQALRRHGGKMSSVAVELGISRPTLYELMEKLGLRKSDPGDGGLTI